MNEVRFKLVARHRTSPKHWLTVGDYQSVAQLRKGLLSTSAYWAVFVVCNSTASPEIHHDIQLWADGVFGHRRRWAYSANLKVDNKWHRWRRNEFGSCILIDRNGRIDFLPRWYRCEAK